MIPRLVLDASVVLTWFLNATEEQSRYAEAVAALIERDATTCVVPGLWHIEVGAQLLKRRSAGELSRVKLNDAIAKLDRLTIETHHVAYNAREIVKLGQRYQLAGYDATYFDLAARFGLPIAAIDAGIRTACENFGVELISAEKPSS